MKYILMLLMFFGCAEVDQPISSQPLAGAGAVGVTSAALTGTSYQKGLAKSYVASHYASGLSWVETSNKLTGTKPSRKYEIEYAITQGSFKHYYIWEKIGTQPTVFRSRIKCPDGPPVGSSCSFVTSTYP